jgi:hemerythrin-like domain-containing protein
MRDALRALDHEHATFGLLLALVELETEVFEEGGRPDLPAVRDILRYFLTYPDLVHHPVENAMVVRLQLCAPAAARGVGEITADHAHLAALTRRFNAGIGNALHDPGLPRHWFGDWARHFVAAYRWHMAMEEALLFPACERHFDANDWAAVESARPPASDPLAAPPGAGQTAQLRDRLRSLARPERGRRLTTAGTISGPA